MGWQRRTAQPIDCICSGWREAGTDCNFLHALLMRSSPEFALASICMRTARRQQASNKVHITSHKRSNAAVVIGVAHVAHDAPLFGSMRIKLGRRGRQVAHGGVIDVDEKCGAAIGL